MAGRTRNRRSLVWLIRKMPFLCSVPFVFLFALISVSGQFEITAKRKAKGADTAAGQHVKPIYARSN
jgi:hypothetical protein